MRKIFKNKMWFLALLLTVAMTGCSGNKNEGSGSGGGSSDPGPAGAAITLGAAAPYGVLAGTAITLGGGPASTTGFRVVGDVGESPGSTCNGCDATTVNGTIVSTAVAAVAKTALVAAYDEATVRATTVTVCTIIATGDLTLNPDPACASGAPLGTFFPGYYQSGSTASISIPVDGTITLDAQNNPDAVFIFVAESTVGSLANSHVVLANQAQAKNVFWVAGSTATIGGTGSTFKGTVIALTDVNVLDNTQMVGRALARNGQVTVQDNALIRVP